jgi:hypothetical protein
MPKIVALKNPNTIFPLKYANKILIKNISTHIVAIEVKKLLLILKLLIYTLKTYQQQNLILKSRITLQGLKLLIKRIVFNFKLN